MRVRLLCATLAVTLFAACSEPRDVASPTPVYDRDVAPILAARCTECHAGETPAGGWRSERYLDVVSCVADGSVATAPADARAPLLRALARDDHASRVSSSERATLDAWIAAGAPSSRGGVHPAGIIDPRSPDWHGTLLRATRFAPMLDPSDANACGRCHLGAPSTMPALRAPPPGATACTSCHTEPSGPLGCATCHGDGARATPPRNPCFFPDGPGAGAHAAHTGDSTLRTGELACSTCHPGPSAEAPISGRHVDGTVDVVFDPAVAGPDARYDATTGTCTVGCHAQGGTRPSPGWTEAGPFGCGDCHATPPEDHFPGACTRCHSGPNDVGTALVSTTLHMNGRIDVGDGSGLCGACHGRADDPWPATAAHPAHRDPITSTPVACESCHVVPSAVDAIGHLDASERAEVTFGPAAAARGAVPVWDGSGCTEIACHGAQLTSTTRAMPTFADTSGRERACGACHAVPPSAPHTADPGCNASICHGDEIASWPDGPRISDVGRIRHIDGTIDYGPR